MGQETVLVVGGSRGIGRAIVEVLSQRGFAVAFTWRSESSRADEVVAALDGPARAFQFDLADREGVSDLVDEVEDSLGPIFALVNCGGIRRDAICAMQSDDDWDAVIDTNLGGTFRVCRAALKRMIPRRRGVIVNVGSLSASKGLPGQAAYAASKAGIAAMGRCLAREIGRRGIRVNTVVPGYVETDFVADLPPQAVEHLRAQECLRGGVAPKNVADVVAYLISPEAAALTGQTITVDAGVSS